MTPVGGASPNIAATRAPERPATPETNPETAPDRTGQAKAEVSPEQQALARQQAQGTEAQARRAAEARMGGQGMGDMSFEKAMAMAMAEEKDDAAKDAMKQAQQKGGGGAQGAGGGCGGGGGGCGGAQSSQGAQASQGPQASQDDQGTKQPSDMQNGIMNMFAQSGVVGAALKQMLNGAQNGQ